MASPDVEGEPRGLEKAYSPAAREVSDILGGSHDRAACGVPGHMKQNHCCRSYIPLQSKSECCQEVSGIQVLLHNLLL